MASGIHPPIDSEAAAVLAPAAAISVAARQTRLDWLRRLLRDAG